MKASFTIQSIWCVRALELIRALMLYLAGVLKTWMAVYR